ncbi:hypothetical protein BZA70DRAFT_273139 [Myxozyma melibiosi]|uniref:CBF1-interacting co-repressor CIR N-terminal domain-containing protein n=1 Tax=Myxozyma melibiosi TaxID=54550 RepID=A0ABR1FFU3_9ASCO
MPIKLLKHKSYHVYNQANIERVRRDEEEARARAEKEDEQLREKDRAFRLELLRRKQLGEDTSEFEELYRLQTNEEERDRDDDAADSAATKAPTQATSDIKGTKKRKIRNLDDEISEAQRMLSGSEAATASMNLTSKDGHINLFESLEKKSQTTEAGREQPKLRNMRLDHSNSELVPWYATLDPQAYLQSSLSEHDRRRAERVREKSKHLHDPLVSVQGFLKQKALVDSQRKEREAEEPWRKIDRHSADYYIRGPPERGRHEHRRRRRHDRSRSRSRSRSEGEDDFGKGQRQRAPARTGEGKTGGQMSTELQRLAEQQEQRERRERARAEEMLRRAR